MSFLKHSNSIAAGVLAVAVILGTSACSSGAANAGATSGPGTAGIIEFDTTSQIDALFVTGSKSALEADGWTVVSQDPKGDPGQANSICSQFITRQVNILVVTTFAIDQMAQCMSEAKAANIPVFFIASPLVDGMAGAVDVTSPKPINDLFADYIKKNKVTSILALDYSPGTPCRMRKEYRAELLKSLNVTVSEHEFTIPGQVVDAQNATAAWLAANPEGAGNYAIWACFTDPTAGAVAAINQAGRTDSIPVFTWDFNKTIVEPLKSGQVAATLSLDGNAVGAQVAKLVKAFQADGKAVGVPAENVILTKDTLDKFLADNPNALK
jgi:ribose transport system substrate-binding protein